MEYNFILSGSYQHFGNCFEHPAADRAIDFDAVEVGDFTNSIEGFIAGFDLEVVNQGPESA